jgi:adenylate cyclase
MEGEPRAIYRFDRFMLDLDRGLLLGDDGEELALRPKAFAMFRHFVENADRLIDRDELMRTIWPDIIVSDDSIAQCISEIRRALGAGGRRLLRAVQRRGYRFEGSVSKDEQEKILGLPEIPVFDALPPPAAVAGNPPTIAVLPFQNMSDDPEQDYFADGIVEEIITAL